jgi:NADPH:quinone reductase
MARQLVSTVREDGLLELSVIDVEVPDPADDEIVLRVEAAPINPSDLGQMFGLADVRTARASGQGANVVVTAEIPNGLIPALAGRVGVRMPIGSEGSGTVVAAGSSDTAQALLGKTVATLSGGMYSELRVVRADQCLVLPDGTTPAQAASCFVNPLTALGMVDTMRLEGHTALVHTAAASNLGQMLVKLCATENVPLVNVVRRSEHVDLLHALGAAFVCNSSDANFTASLTKGVEATDATIAFDAVGGGTLASDILTAMEAAQSRKVGTIGGYGSTTHKQVYIYGGLDRSPIELTRAFGAAWGVGGWLLPIFLERVGPERARELRERVAAEIATTFASAYTAIVSLDEALAPDAIAAYAKRATGQKYLINPNKDGERHSPTQR